MKSKNLYEIEGDLLECDVQYIAHQCNCVSKTASGLAGDIFKKFPWADIYSPRKKCDNLPMDGQEFGEIVVCGDGEQERYVINMMAQYRGGGIIESVQGEDQKDGEIARKEHFMKALNKITKIENLKEIAFPYGVGCGIAGGDWNVYAELIDRFVSLVDADVYIIKLRE